MTARRQKTTKASQPRRSTARLHLPHLGADEALLVVATFEKAIDAIWRAHGDAMADHLAATGTQVHRPQGAVWAGTTRDHPPDPDIDF